MTVCYFDAGEIFLLEPTRAMKGAWGLFYCLILSGFRLSWSPRLEFPPWRWANKNFEWLSQTNFEVSFKNNYFYSVSGTVNHVWEGAILNSMVDDKWNLTYHDMDIRNSRSSWF